jgi:hypothetical protein
MMLARNRHQPRRPRHVRCLMRREPRQQRMQGCKLSLISHSQPLATKQDVSHIRRALPLLLSSATNARMFHAFALFGLLWGLLHLTLELSLCLALCLALPQGLCLLLAAPHLAAQCACGGCGWQHVGVVEGNQILQTTTTQTLRSREDYVTDFIDACACMTSGCRCTPGCTLVTVDVNNGRVSCGHKSIIYHWR